MKVFAVLALAVAASITVAAQNPAPASSTKDPVSSTVRQMEARYSKNLIGAADEMPPDKYSYRPTPQQMSFAHLMLHVAEANYHLCASLAGEQAKALAVTENDPKEKIAPVVKDSFTYCEGVLAKADDSKLGTQAPTFLRTVAGWADHYSAAAMYLRLNNLTPPSAEKSTH